MLAAGFGPRLVGHAFIIDTISDDLDSDRIVTQSVNGNVRVWDRESGDQIGNEIKIPRQQTGLDMTTASNGDLIGVSRDSEFALWNFDIDTSRHLPATSPGAN